MTLLWVALGGAFGAMARFLLSQMMFQWANKPFPYGTLSVNLIGSFAIGVAYVWLSGTAWSGNQGRLLVMVGFLGAFTTFSTFSLESLTLLQQSRLAEFFTYMALSVGGCLIATATGMWFTKQLV